MPSPEKKNAAPLDPWIIEEIRRREEEEKGEQNRERPVVNQEPPEQRPEDRDPARKEKREDGDRGVAIIGNDSNFGVFK